MSAAAEKGGLNLGSTIGRSSRLAAILKADEELSRHNVIFWLNTFCYHEAFDHHFVRLRYNLNKARVFVYFRHMAFSENTKRLLRYSDIPEQLSCIDDA